MAGHSAPHKDDRNGTADARRQDERLEQAAADSTELKELRFYAEQVEADNKMLRELVDNQRNDIDCLLKLTRKVTTKTVKGDRCPGTDQSIKKLLSTGRFCILLR